VRRALLLTLALVLLAPAVAQAARPNVVVVIFDEFPSTSLLGSNHHIDAVRYPNFAALARGSTWFRNATSVSDTTFAAVPSILDGRLHSWKVGERAHPPSGTCSTRTATRSTHRPRRRSARPATAAGAAVPGRC
jgi:hypothetical protein